MQPAQRRTSPSPSGPRSVSPQARWACRSEHGCNHVAVLPGVGLLPHRRRADARRGLLSFVGQLLTRWCHRVGRVRAGMRWGVVGSRDARVRGCDFRRTALAGRLWGSWRDSGSSLRDGGGSVAGPGTRDGCAVPPRATGCARRVGRSAARPQSVPRACGRPHVALPSDGTGRSALHPPSRASAHARGAAAVAHRAPLGDDGVGSFRG